MRKWFGWLIIAALMALMIVLANTGRGVK